LRSTSCVADTRITTAPSVHTCLFLDGPAEHSGPHSKPCASMLFRRSLGSNWTTGTLIGSVRDRCRGGTPGRPRLRSVTRRKAGSRSTGRALQVPALRGSGRPGLQLARTTRSRSARPAELVSAVESEIARRNIPTVRLVSGAGHDAQELASITSSAMVFVRGQKVGVSHSPGSTSPKKTAPSALARSPRSPSHSPNRLNTVRASVAAGLGQR